MQHLYERFKRFVLYIFFNQTLILKAYLNLLRL